MVVQVLAAYRKTWCNEKHEKQWSSTLEAHGFPQIGNVAISEVTGPVIRNGLAILGVEAVEEM